MYQPPRSLQLKNVVGAAAALLALILASFTAGAQAPAQKPPAAGESKAEPAASTGNVENGKKLYNDVGCWQCHGYSGQGGSAGPRITPPMPLDFFTKIVHEGRDEMPPYSSKVLPDAQIADIHAFLTSLPKPKDSKAIPLLNQQEDAKPPAAVSPGTSPSQTTEPKPPSSGAGR